MPDKVQGFGSRNIRLRTCAGEHQVSHAGQAPTGEGVGAQSTARRVISARPRVIRAARALCPKPRPSEMPQAMASTFFSAPPSSTPAQALGLGSRVEGLGTGVRACS